MRVILGNFYQPTIEAGSLQITRSVSDPVPTCQFNLIDNTSSLTIQGMQELIILDEKAIPNPTINVIQDPDIEILAGVWNVGVSIPTGCTTTQLSGPTFGAKITAANIASGLYKTILGHAATPATPGQQYMFSFFVQGGSSPTNIGVYAEMDFQDFAGNTLGSPSYTGPVPISTSQIRPTVQGTAPAGTVYVTWRIGINVSSNTNSGTITVTDTMCEPMWLPTLSYPTPWCGPGATNCQQLPFVNQWIRQYRKFAGFVNHDLIPTYHGNVRTFTVDAVGYAWLTSIITSVNDSFTNSTDATIISSLASNYLVAFSVPGSQWDLATTTNLATGGSNLVTGQTLSNFGSNADDLRTLFDNLASTSGFFWTIDNYWNLIYAPPGYNTMTISLICDNSSQPDNVTTFPAYNFQPEMDYTQPGSNILVIGSGSNVAQVIDPNVPQNLISIAGYGFKNTIFMRKVNDSTLQSVQDCTNRGIAEIIQYDYARKLYHLNTNVELIPGQGIAVTSNTDNLNKTVLLIQQVQGKWLGTNELLQDEWEYQVDLGAVNRHATTIMSRLFRMANKNTSAPSVSTTTLVVFEQAALVESVATGTAATNYFATVQGDGPAALYPCNELAGTILDDTSGKAQQGTISAAGVTYGASSLLTNPADTADTALTLNGSTGVLTLPVAVNGNGLSAWSVEVWFSLSSTALGSATAIAVCGTGTNTVGWQLYWTSNTTLNWTVGTGASSATASFAVAAATNTPVYLLGTYDGANVRLYVNGSLKATTALTGAISASTNAPTIGAYNNSTHFFPGTIQYVGLYSATLSGTQASAHNTAGT